MWLILMTKPLNVLSLCEITSTFIAHLGGRLRNSISLTSSSTHFALLFIIFTDIGVGVEIREMRVPPVIQSGSVDHVILDCNYDVTHMEGKQLDIKWFFGDDHQPFYQWLPGHR